MKNGITQNNAIFIACSSERKVIAINGIIRKPPNDIEQNNIIRFFILIFYLTRPSAGNHR